jgi:transcriptional regulator with XRE-family HTH domain
MDAEFWSEVIGANVFACRCAAKMTQDELAKALDGKTTRQAISRLESGKHLPSLKTLLKIAEALNVPPTRLFEVSKKKK